MTEIVDWLTQDVSAPVWMWLLCVGCTVKCLLGAADYVAHRRWRDRGPVDEDSSY